MKVPISWLRDYVDIPISIEELANRLTLAGMEVEHIEYYGVPGSDLVWDREKIVTAQIVEVKAHPNADRLVLADVDYGGARAASSGDGRAEHLPSQRAGALGERAEGGLCQGRLGVV